MATETKDTKEPTEPKGTEQLKQKLQQHLEEAKQRFEDARNHLASMGAEDQEQLKNLSAEIQGRIDSQRQRAQDVRDQVSTWIREKKEQGEEAIRSWQQKRSIKKLEHRADRAEEYAINSLVVAMMDADEAEMAMLDAVQARIDADASYKT
ncbi:MAG TPA: hypothetical protein VIV11_36410 [Kofleriaceae bacterium]